MASLSACDARPGRCSQYRDPGDLGGDRLELAPDSLGGVGLHVEGVEVAEAAGREDQDHRLRPRGRGSTRQGRGPGGEQGGQAEARGRPENPTWRNSRRTIPWAWRWGVGHRRSLANRTRARRPDRRRIDQTSLQHSRPAKDGATFGPMGASMDRAADPTVLLEIPLVVFLGPVRTSTTARFRSRSGGGIAPRPGPNSSLEALAAAASCSGSWKKMADRYWVPTSRALAVQGRRVVHLPEGGRGGSRTETLAGS